MSVPHSKGGRDHGTFVEVPVRAPARTALHEQPLPRRPLQVGTMLDEDDFPTNPAELPDGSPQQFDALARQRRLRQERVQPPDELPPVA